MCTPLSELFRCFPPALIRFLEFLSLSLSFMIQKREMRALSSCWLDFHSKRRLVPFALSKQKKRLRGFQLHQVGIGFSFLHFARIPRGDTSKFGAVTKCHQSFDLFDTKRTRRIHGRTAEKGGIPPVDQIPNARLIAV